MFRYSSHSLYNPFFIFIIICFSNFFVRPHDEVVHNIGATKVQGKVGNYIPLVLLTDMTIHSAKTQYADDSKYMMVNPATVYPVHQFSLGGPNQAYFPLPTNYPSLLQELRSFHSFHYSDIVVLDGYIFLHLLPNKIVIVKQEIATFNLKNRFKLENSYSIEGLTSKNLTKMYGIKNGKANEVLLVVIESNIMYKLGVNQHQKYDLSHKNKISHLTFISDNLFAAAETGLGIKIYSINPNKIQLLKIISCQSLLKGKDKQVEEAIGGSQKTEICQINDIYYNSSSSQIYFLDSKTGIHSSLVNTQLREGQLFKNISLLVGLKQCDAMDFVSSDHIVILCNVGMPNSYIQEIYRFPDIKHSDKQIYVKKDPLYHNCNFKDLIVTERYFLIYDSFSMDIFWNNLHPDESFRVFQEHTKQHFNLPGLQTFSVKKVIQDNFLYAVESGTLVKYKLNEYPGVILFKSDVPVQKQIPLSIPKPCNHSLFPILTNNNEINKNVECKYILTVELAIEESPTSINEEKVSMSFGAIIIMVTVLLILTWICLVKYKGIEKHAKKILEYNRQKRQYNSNKFTI